MRVRRYETVLMLPPDLDEGRTGEILARLEGVVERSGGIIVKKEDWGTRKLAYEIKRHSKGRYILLDLVGQTRIVHELERHIKMIESVMRFLTVKRADEVDMEAVKKEQVEEREKEKARKAAAQERRASEAAEAREPKVEAVEEAPEGEREEGAEEEAVEEEGAEDRAEDKD